MVKPIHTNYRGYDPEHMVDLDDDQLAELDARASMQVDGRLPLLAAELRRRYDARCYVLLTLCAVMIALCFSGVLRSEATEPKYPGESRAWMGDTLKNRHHRLAVAGGGRR